MSDVFAVSAPKIFDGDKWHIDAALIIENVHVRKIVPKATLQNSMQVFENSHGFITPGFVDLQVNGGGGVLLNNDPSLSGIKTICQAHAKFGTTSLFPTLITDSIDVRDAAIAAASEAKHQDVPGFAGLHLEGPHLSIARKGAHDPKLVRPMTNEDVAILIAAHAKIGALIITVAAESVTVSQVAELKAVGIKISLGHCDAGIEQISSLLDAGASMFTHLFNAMSQMSGREPGMVGTALGSNAYASIIADGHHVHPQSIKNALAVKQHNSGEIFLISDAMSFTGTQARELNLNGRKILRQGGRLTLENGTLAGADIEMLSAVKYMHHQVKLDLTQALRMATIFPCAAAGLKGLGELQPGAGADFVWLNDKIEVLSTWIKGRQV